MLSKKIFHASMSEGILLISPEPKAANPALMYVYVVVVDEYV